MDGKKGNIDQSDEYSKALSEEFNRLSQSSSIAKKDQFQTPDPSVVDHLELNKRQKKILFNFVLIVTSCLLTLLVLGISIQAYYTINYNSNFKIMDNLTLNIVAVSIFGQFIGIVYIIAKRLWDDQLIREINKNMKGKK